MSATVPPNSDFPRPARVAALWRGGSLLTLALGMAAGALAVYVRQDYGTPGVQSVLLAFAVCLIGALIAYAIAVFTVGTPKAMPGLMGAMFFRTGLPVVAGIVGSSTVEQLHDVGFMGHCMALFLVALVSEVWLNLRLIKAAAAGRAAGQSTPGAGKHIATAL
jgi:hypothetical protein